MSKQSVIDQLLFWESGTWTARADATPSAVSPNDISRFTQSIIDLYDNSLTMRAALENLAATGPIRIASGSYSRHAPSDENIIHPSDPYLLLAPDQPVISIDSYGTVYEVPFLITLAHEIGHYAYGFSDSPAIDNASLNAADADYVGQNLRLIERPVSDELGEYYLRPSYTAQFDERYTVFGELAVDQNYTEYNPVDLVRFGNIEESSADIIDISARTDNLSLLAFGSTGNDTITGGTANDGLYGGADQDAIDGGDGDDHLFGGTGYDSLSGGSGADTLIADDDDTEDQLDGGSGGESYGAGDMIYAGKNDVVVHIDEFDTIFFRGEQLVGASRVPLDGEQIPTSGTYQDGNGFAYVYDAQAHTLVVNDGTDYMTIKDFSQSIASTYLATIQIERLEPSYELSPTYGCF